MLKFMQSQLQIVGLLLELGFGYFALGDVKGSADNLVDLALFVALRVECCQPPGDFAVKHLPLFGGVRQSRGMAFEQALLL